MQQDGVGSRRRLLLELVKLLERVKLAIEGSVGEPERFGGGRGAGVGVDRIFELARDLQMRKLAAVGGERHAAEAVGARGGPATAAAEANDRNSRRDTPCVSSSPIWRSTTFRSVKSGNFRGSRRGMAVRPPDMRVIGSIDETERIGRSTGEEFVVGLDAERDEDAVRVVEPGAGLERFENVGVVEADGPQRLEIVRGNRFGRPGHLDGEGGRASSRGDSGAR